MIFIPDWLIESGLTYLYVKDMLLCYGQNCFCIVGI